MRKRHPLNGLDDEIRDHIDREALDNVAMGMHPLEARRAALRKFGAPLRTHEDARAVWIPVWLDTLRLEVRQGIRSLLRSPGYLLASVLTVALTLGANAAIFSAVHAVLLSPLPIREPDRLVVGWEINRSRNQSVVEISYRDFEAWQGIGSTFAEVAAFGSSIWSLSLEDDIDPVRLAAVGVSSNFFDTLGTPPLWGRFFRAEDDRSGVVRPLVLSHRVWRTRFAADPAIVGATIVTGDGPAEIIGVAPADFDFPRGVDVWLPVVPVLAGVAGIDGLRDVSVLFTVARLHEATSAQTAEANLQRMVDNSASIGDRFGTAVQLTPFLEYELGPVRAALWWLWAAVGLLLLVACGNVAALMLGRTVQHRREHALRRALGASATARWRSTGVEALVIAVVGGLCGLVAARWFLHAIVALAPDDAPRLAGATVSLTVVGFTFILVLVVAFLTASVSLLQARRLSLVDALRESGHAVTGTSLKTRAWLVGAQVALSVLLMTGAGLMLRSYLNLRHLNLGFVPENVVTFEIDSRRAGAAHNEWAAALVARLEEMRDIDAVGVAHVRPLGLGAIGTDSTIVLEGQPNARTSAGPNPLVNYNAVSPGYFPAMRIRLAEGRLFTADDGGRSRRVVVVSESTARTLWPNQDPLGRRVSLLAVSEGDPAESWRTVIGVVGDVRYRGLDDVRLDIYEPASQSSARAGYLVVRSTRDGLAIAGAIQAEARRVEPRAIFNGTITMEAVVRRATATWTLAAWLFGLFAVSAVVLVCVGLFSTLSLEVTRRSREFALRIALGARAADIVRRALGTIGGCVLSGAAIGLVLAVLTAGFLGRLLFEIQPVDAVTYAAVVCMIALTAGAACLVPIHRVTRISPVDELRRID